jgi:hypothetical protein
MNPVRNAIRSQKDTSSLSSLAVKETWADFRKLNASVPQTTDVAALVGGASRDGYREANFSPTFH